MEAFRIFDVCEELPKDAKITTTRRENVAVDETSIPVTPMPTVT